jgi:hypothetical protein
MCLSQSVGRSLLTTYSKACMSEGRSAENQGRTDVVYKLIGQSGSNVQVINQIQYSVRITFGGVLVNKTVTTDLSPCR